MNKLKEKNLTYYNPDGQPGNEELIRNVITGLYETIKEINNTHIKKVKIQLLTDSSDELLTFLDNNLNNDLGEPDSEEFFIFQRKFKKLIIEEYGKERIIDILYSIHRVSILSNYFQKDYEYLMGEKKYPLYIEFNYKDINIFFQVLKMKYRIVYENKKHTLIKEDKQNE